MRRPRQIKPEKIVGILGGMGPEATSELFRRIIKATPAQRDQDQLRIIVDNNPKIPDRTSAIFGEGPTPLPEIIKTAKNIEKAGADFLLVPCITAHYYLDDLKDSIKIPVLNMIELTAQRIRKMFPNLKFAGIIATTGTVNTRIYDDAMRKVRVGAIYPSTENQCRVMKAIYDVKAGTMIGARKTLVTVANHLMQSGSQIVVCGCTEVSLALCNGDVHVPVVDPLQILAETAVAKALATESERVLNS